MREDDSELVEEDSREEDHGGEAGGKDEDCEEEELKGGEGREGREGEDDEKGREEGNEGGEEAGEEDERQQGDGEEDLGEEKEEEEERRVAEGHRDTNEDEAQSVEETAGAGEAHRDRRGWTGGGKEGREAERLSRGVEELSLSGGPSILLDAFLPSRFSGLLFAASARDFSASSQKARPRKTLPVCMVTALSIFPSAFSCKLEAEE
ncbi:hypothetical protein TGPRC2_244220 [Toxoplasma gondii TgCatPRC2]|uniref:Uncharacterized protein n=2 Tax=Toxoplasma gondii TaxID=5811 RepID=A0A151HRH9_TOXGO|nr:hypothetical protein TGARI_244220 [Toxoplasma gondii ARI]KYK72025.1 hypothetical protein TGPRC2_244220 [Toxoplasma gondii TgCatPRC2]